MSPKTHFVIFIITYLLVNFIMLLTQLYQEVSIFYKAENHIDKL